MVACWLRGRNVQGDGGGFGSSPPETFYLTAYTDDGGVTWTQGDSSVNDTDDDVGTCSDPSPAFDAAGEAMVAFCFTTGQDTQGLYEDVSTDGGATWSTAGNDRLITSFDASDTNASCLGGEGALRCSSSPTLAGDPNSNDAGSHAFFVAWSEARSTANGSGTATVAQVMGLSTVDGVTWDHLDYMSNNDLGDKFSAAASFSENGRLTVSFSSREATATASEPNGDAFNQHLTEADSLTSLRNGSFSTATTDPTLGGAGDSGAGDTPVEVSSSNTSSLDDNDDTFMIWTDLRSGVPEIRTQDACYQDCLSFLQSDVPVSVGSRDGISFTDYWGIDTDPEFGSGSGYWNVVGIRPGTDGSTSDDDISLYPNRYFATPLASSEDGEPTLDYVLVNGNPGHAPSGTYYPAVNGYMSFGGDYSIEWDAGGTQLATSLAGTMAASDIVRVADTHLTTGTRYYFGLRPNAGNTSGYSLALHAATDGSEQGRDSAVAQASQLPAGSPAFISYNTGSDPTQSDGIVVVNDNSGSGTYTLYRDTVAPTGTIQIDGGAASTTSTTAQLTLSGHNATSGDPVSDMAFSVDGGAYSAFQPYATSAHVTLPATAGRHTVAVEYRNGAGAVSAPVTASITLGSSSAPTPTVTGVSPSSGPTAGGNTITITGTGFASGATVKVGTIAATKVTYISSTTLTAVAPAQAAGSHNVYVTTTGGTSATTTSDTYVYRAVPTVTGVSPSSGPTAGGNTITITGTGFASGATVKVGTIAATKVTYISSTTLTAVAPAQAAGSHNVYVTTTGGTSATTTSDTYVYRAVPTVTGVSPSSGPTAGGNTITITGTGFASGATVKVGTIAATKVTYISSTTLTAVAPAQAAGSHNVYVTTTGGTSATTTSDRYTYGAID